MEVFLEEVAWEPSLGGRGWKGWACPGSHPFWRAWRWHAPPRLALTWWAGVPPQIAKDVKQFYDQALQQAVMDDDANNAKAVVKTFHETVRGWGRRGCWGTGARWAGGGRAWLLFGLASAQTSGAGGGTWGLAGLLFKGLGAPLGHVGPWGEPDGPASQGAGFSEQHSSAEGRE